MLPQWRSRLGGETNTDEHAVDALRWQVVGQAQAGDNV